MANKYNLSISLSIIVEAETTEHAINIAHQFYSGEDKLQSVTVSAYPHYEPETSSMEVARSN